jgi:enamine deaminase RidA (YjgF/YER057c/UK114 family)
MTVTLIDPEGLPEVGIYRQVAVATGSKLVFVAGQIAKDADGRTVGPGDLAAQSEQAYLNVATALAAVHRIDDAETPRHPTEPAASAAPTSWSLKTVERFVTQP